MGGDALIRNKKNGMSQGDRGDEDSFLVNVTKILIAY